jgi:hypothetical protein
MHAPWLSGRSQSTFGQSLTALTTERGTLGGLGTAEWLTVTGVVATLIAAVTAVVIYRMQRSDNRTLAESQGDEREDVRRLLRTGTEITTKVRHNCPYTASGLAGIGLEEFRLEAARLSRFGPTELREHMAALSRLAGELATEAISEAVPMAGPAEPEAGLAVDPRVQSGRQAVRQFEVNTRLEEQIVAAGTAFRNRRKP